MNLFLGILIFNFLLFPVFPCLSQSPTWVDVQGGVGSESITDLDADQTGNTYITGKMTTTAIFGNYTLSSAGMQDAFIAKITTNDSVLWAKRFGGTNEDIGKAVCEINDRVFVTGTYWGTIIIGTDTFISQGLEDVFLACLDTSGTVLWAKSYGGNNTEEPGDLKMDPNGNLLLSINFLNYTVVDSLTFLIAGGVLVDMNLNGQLLWTKACPHINTYEFECLSTGKLVIAGEFDGPVYFDTIPLTGLGFSDLFVALLDTNHVTIWAKRFGGNTNGPYDRVNGLAVDGQDNIYFTGQYRLTMNFGTQTLVGPGITNAVVGKLSANGSPIWAKTNGGTMDEVGNDIAISGDRIFFTGSFNGTLTWGSFSFVSGGGLDPYIGMMDTAGAFIWVVSYANTGADEYGVALDFDANGHCYFGGVMSSSAQIDTFLVYGSGGDNVLLVKFSDVYLGYEESAGIRNPIKLYPNPTSGILNIDWDETNPPISDVVIYSLLGEPIRKLGSFHSIRNETSLYPNLPNGFYILEIKDIQGGVHSATFSIVK